ncbi:MAG: sensor histidine kinase [Bacteroidetes bacterium]|nr:MAG: sensor histidine kinase [Bacteroidota bacterium]
MKKQLTKYGLYLSGALFFVSFLLYYQGLVSPNYGYELEKLQSVFLQKEDALEKYIGKKAVLMREKGLENLLMSEQESPFFVHIYRNDSLVFWNTNALPVLNFADLHYPSDGLVKLQNGWYYAKSFEYSNIRFVASFLIQNDYAYENDYLNRAFAPDFKTGINAPIVLETESEYSVRDKNGKFLFALDPQEELRISSLEQNILVFLLFFSIAIFCFALYRNSRDWNALFQFLLLAAVLLVHLALVRSEAYRLMDGTAFSDPAVYANSWFFPNLLLYCFNAMIFLFEGTLLVAILKKLPSKQLFKWLSLLLFLLSLLAAHGIGYLYLSIVMDSSIPFEIGKLFRLNMFSVWAALGMGLLFYTYFILIRGLIKMMQHQQWKKTTLVVIWFLSSIGYFLFDVVGGFEQLYLGLWPMLVNGVILFVELRQSGRYGFNYGVLLLLLFSWYIALNIDAFNEVKEKKERELYAGQLASDQDILTELEYVKVREKMKEDRYIKQLVSPQKTLTSTEFQDHMERSYFNGFWDRYACEFYLFDGQGKALLSHTRQDRERLEQLEEVLEKHSIRSEIDSQVFYVTDFTSQLSYIGKHSFDFDGSEIILYATFKSKQIPEKIGFPRLLISSKTGVFSSLENYSIAKYYKGNLVSQYGRFSFPTREEALVTDRKIGSGFFDGEEYNHLLYRKSDDDAVVLSRKLPSTFQLLTSFSYLFCFFGLLLLIPLAVNNYSTFQVSKLSFALKIQLTFLSIIIIALVAFGIGSGKFVRSQYNEYSNELIKEKIKSVQVEVKHKLEKEENLAINEQGAYLNYLMRKFASVFVTDINLYDKHGYLLASSRPKVYNVGLLSEQINPGAYRQLYVNKKSEFIHQEHIGSLIYLSAYVPLYNYDGKFLAFVNLQHFGQQKGFEHQIENFLVAIINVFILLLAISVVLTIFVSNWVTAPLRELRQNLAKIQLGKYNKPIEYQPNDEIGALVRNYNQKLEELAYTAEQLAISERESAWREMAKQVAHEIKNPLTPMKLSLQHLQRVYDPNDPDSRQKIDRVANSLIEQIDALTNIANEFSNFAKMPVGQRVELDLVSLLEGTVLLFGQREALELRFESKLTRAAVEGDKDLLLRVFNNLLKNAIQAIPDDRKGMVVIELERKEDLFVVRISDNGKGIEEELQGKIFVPNFTTKSKGTGLGLAMVRQIIELHEGRVWFETKPGEGTTFHVQLPIYRA